MYPQALGDQLLETGLFHADDLPLPDLLLVDITHQTLTHFRAGDARHVYPVSTSRHGPGNRKDSFQTPLGLHRICEKIGAGCAAGEIFRARVPQGEIFTRSAGADQDDVITSRILWLAGLQADLNLGGDCDSKERYIYVHGTADEASIGRPASIGCVRMLNHDVIELFNQVEVGTHVFITESL